MKSGDLNVTAADEIQRIRAEYKRRGQAVSPDFYSWAKPVNYFFHSQLCRALIGALVKEGMYPLDGLKVLDVGCGGGVWLLEFAQWNAQELFGIDLDEKRIKLARRRLPNSEFYCGDARSLPWKNNAFDLVTQFTMFTSVLNPAVKQALATEMVRVVKPSGAIVWYDFCFDNPSNPNVRGIRQHEISELFAGCRLIGRKVTLAPPIARRLVPFSWPLAVVMEQLPFLCTHYLGLIRKR